MGKAEGNWTRSYVKWLLYCVPVWNVAYTEYMVQSNLFFEITIATALFLHWGIAEFKTTWQQRRFGIKFVWVFTVRRFMLALVSTNSPLLFETYSAFYTFRIELSWVLRIAVSSFLSFVLAGRYSYIASKSVTGTIGKCGCSFDLFFSCLTRWDDFAPDNQDNVPIIVRIQPHFGQQLSSF